MDNISTGIMFEEIKLMLKKLSDKLENNTQSTGNVPDFSDIKNCINESNEQLLSKLDDIQPTTQKVHHRVSIDIKSSWILVTMIGLFLFLISSLVLNFKQKQANEGLSDNDLKYRYIKMQGAANAETLLYLETIFTYNRDEESIGIIKQRVVEFERLVEEQAEKMERARLNATEAEELQRKAEGLKE